MSVLMRNFSDPGAMLVMYTTSFLHRAGRFTSHLSPMPSLAQTCCRTHQKYDPPCTHCQSNLHLLPQRCCHAHAKPYCCMLHKRSSKAFRLVNTVAQEGHCATRTAHA
uniref:Uncharacterized protein n=1 Tax=Dunaliella tertiolecta TaxID=3047 RepID=A0A7S3QKB7_DUNTE